MTKFVEMPLLPDSDAAHGGRFSYTVAADVKRAFKQAAQKLDDQAGSRASYVTTAQEEFSGHYADVFQANAATAVQDASNLASALRTVAGYVDQMITAGKQEDARRKEDNEWVRRHNQREEERSHHNLFEKAGDGLHDIFVGEEERPNQDPIPAPTFPAADVNQGSRQEYSPASAGSTSSAKPENLRSFSTGSGTLNDELSGTAGSLETQLSDFASSCAWGTLSASGVIRAYRSYLTANENDVTWARTIADGFAAAGGEGNVSTVSDAALADALSAAGVSEKRSALVIDPPTAAGAMPSSGYADDPVNTATGNFIEPETDLAFGGVAASLVLSRMYNSLPSGLTEPGVFGPGWASVLDQQLVLTDAGARWVKEDGRAVDFPREGERWGRGVGENFWLSREAVLGEDLAELVSVPTGTDELLVVRDNVGGWWAHTLSGAWVGAGSGPGRTVSAVRGERGEIARLEHAHGRFLDLDHADGRLVVATGSDGRRVEFGYDDAGRLIRADSAVGSRRYRWNEAGLVDQVVSAAGVVEAQNTYDETGRVLSQVSAHGRVSRYAYLPGRVTVVSDPDGSRSNAWIADAKGRLVGVRDAQDQRQSMAYDPHGNLVSFTERDGSVTVHAFDSRGRKTRTVSPEGADITYGYDEWDRVTTVVTASGSVVEYEYARDTDRDPSRIRDALGGVSELVWDRGLLRRVTGPAGVTVVFGYDEFGDLVSTTNAVGDTARIVRDGAGRPVEAITPSGATTRFRYDGVGNLLAREEPDGGRWTFEHDAAGRVVALTDPVGATTSLEYGPTGDLVATTDALGRRVERVLDDLGNVASAILPDGARWGFEHDALSRLTAITDPAGQSWRREYDRIGELTAVVDPTGVRVEASTDRKAGTATLRDAFTASSIRFDEFGRPVQTSGEDGSAELVTYDSAGNPVELVDGEGGLTRLVRDTAGRITEVVSPSGASTRYEYDACGRPWRTMDPTGAVTELEYDADSRVARRRTPAGVQEFGYDVCGRLTVRRDADGGLSRFGYDKAGRLSFASDRWYGTRRFGYDLAGELTSTTNGVGGVTRFEYDSRSRLVRITDPNGGVTTRTYTQLDRVDTITDPAGRVTTATYDAAGRQLSQTDPDGHTTTWSHDEAGQETGLSVDGHVVSTLQRDVLGRQVVITDHTRADGELVEHALSFDRRGLLTAHRRSGAVQGAMAWEYDADGNRIAFTDTADVRTTFTRDAAGRILSVEDPRLGRAVFERDAAGRPVRSVAGELVQEWVYRHGRLSEHTRSSTADPAVAETTLLGYDEEGRLTRVGRDGQVTEYGYDGAGQLTSARNGGRADTWVYDAGGRLLEESTAAGVRRYTYDVAGELAEVREPDGSRTRFVYDGLGRRVRRILPDGSCTEYAWGQTGYLAGTTERDPDGRRTGGHELWVDALGVLADVDGTSLSWDTSGDIPVLAGIGETQVLNLPGGVTGVGSEWTGRGWRSGRATEATHPWAVIGTQTVVDPLSGAGAPAGPGGVGQGLEGLLPSGVGLTASGGVAVAGLEWLGARAYDPATRGFLSTDPLAPTLGAGWDGNPYAYAGNNPLAFSDPSGLTPLTDEELKAYDDSARSGLAKAGSWIDDNKAYILGGLAIAGGIALMCTGVGGPVGMALVGAASGALISGGSSAVIQQATTGRVDAAQLWRDTATGAIGGFVGGGTAGLMARGSTAIAASGSTSRIATATQTVIRNSTARSTLAAGFSGSSSNVAGTALDPDADHSVASYLTSAGTGFVTSAGGSYATARLSTVASTYVSSRITPNWTGPVGTGSHSGAPYNWGGIVTEKITDHVSGAIVSTVQGATAPDGLRLPSVAFNALSGFIGGGSGPSSSTHAAGL